MNWTLKRQKSITSQAASISAWWAVFDWFSIVAATMVERQGPASSSAARRKTAARSSHGRRCQSSQAFAAASTARSISPAPPLCTSASTCALSWGMTALKVSPVRTSSPPMMEGMSSCSFFISFRRASSSARSGESGARSARSARRTGLRWWAHATGSSPPAVSARTGRSGSDTSGVSWSSKMSFSEDVRNELASIAPERECDRLAELSALFHFAGRLHLLGRGSVSVHLDVASAAVARRAFALLRSFGVASEIRTYRRRSFGQETRYQLHVEGGLELLREAGVVDARLAHADHANLVRSGRAAHAQLEAVRRLQRSRRFDELSPRLREIAELRLRHPSLALRELGAKCEPPVSKASAHRRLQAILRLARR